jgi:ABC-2 type transport system ATP-binding protein
MSYISLAFALGLSFTWTHSIILPNKLSIYYQLRQDVAMSVNAAIQVRGLSKNYGAKTAVDGIDLTVERGEIFALLGPNGAGKTTTVEILEGYRKASSGDVSVLGFDPATRGNAAQQWRNQIGIVLQSTSDAADLSVLETISHYANYYENPRDVEQVIDEVGLREKVNAKARELSGGQRRRLDVALGIIGSPELLFLDEPTTGFDPEARRSFWDLIRVLKAEGTTILLTTHYLDEAQALADRVGVINNGKILEIATPQTLGGRNHAPVKVTWLENGVTNQINTQDPTAEVLKLSQRFNGQIPELEVLRPNLEEIYLKMIGELR